MKRAEPSEAAVWRVAFAVLAERSAPSDVNAAMAVALGYLHGTLGPGPEYQAKRDARTP